jgi:hypothetical protein
MIIKILAALAFIATASASEYAVNSDSQSSQASFEEVDNYSVKPRKKVKKLKHVEIEVKDTSNTNRFLPFIAGKIVLFHVIPAFNNPIALAGAIPALIGFGLGNYNEKAWFPRNSEEKTSSLGKTVLAGTIGGVIKGAFLASKVGGNTASTVIYGGIGGGIGGMVLSLIWGAIFYPLIGKPIMKSFK